MNGATTTSCHGACYLRGIKCICKSEDRNSQNWQEAMMGYERGYSESTSRTYDMPLNSYDPTVGAYRNSDQPTEILNTDDNAQQR
ncbi:MAG: hypothetical protein HYS08_01330 [Chlamydiae bacterium]|nr:hypothetical protein [Chlamydiota bacterium]